MSIRLGHSSIAVARYLLDRAAHKHERGLTPMKIIKLVYTAHGWMLGLYGTPLIKEEVEAWRYGPVIRKLYRAVRKFGSQPIVPQKVKPPKNEADFHKWEKSVMDQTLDKYIQFSALQLSSMTHAPGTPWDVIYNKIGRSLIIYNDLIENHYSRLYRRLIEVEQLSLAVDE